MLKLMEDLTEPLPQLGRDFTATNMNRLIDRRYVYKAVALSAGSRGL